MPTIVTDRRDDPASAVQPPCKKRPALLVSLHDVTPAHAARLERAERLLAALGVPAVTYLLVPDYHGRAPADADGAFVDWCRAPRPFAIEWFLHGFVHRENPLQTLGIRQARLRERLARRFLTAGEGEFLALRGSALDERLRLGIDVFRRVIEAPPAGFVAPAWLYNDELPPALARSGVRFTESHRHVFDVTNQRATRSPVITWASRSLAHRAGSRLTAGVARRLWHDQPVLRVALHPLDFEHPSIVRSIARVLGALGSTRETVTCAGLHGEPGPSHGEPRSGG